METVTPFKEIVDAIKASGGDAFKYCYQCGMCDTVCPWNRVGSFSMRKLVREATFGLTEIESEDIWRCTTAASARSLPPRGEADRVGIALRRIATEYGVFPSRAADAHAARACAPRATRLGDDRAKRGDWAEGLQVRPFKEGMEYLYFVGCYSATIRACGRSPGRPPRS